MEKRKEETLPSTLAGRYLTMIETGELSAGRKMPSIRESVRLSGLSQGTVIEAYRILEDLGVIEAVRGSGYYIHPEKKNSIPRSGRVRETKRIRYDPVMDLAINLENKKLFAPFGLAVPCDELLPVAAMKKQIIQSMRMDDVNRYSFPPGHEGLRKEISSRYAQTGLDIHTDEVILTAGATEAMYAILSEFTKPDDLIAMESPVYGGFIHMARKLGLRVLEIPVDSANGMDTHIFETKLKEGQRPLLVVTIPSYQNPTGALLTEERREHLIALSSKYNFFIIEDDIYAAVHHGPKRMTPLIGLDRERVILISSFSKTVAPPYRMGWIIPPEKFREKLIRNLRTTTLGNSRLIEESLTGFLSSGGFERHLRRLRKESRSRVNIIRESILSSFPEGTRVSSPSGGFLLWVELPAGNKVIEIQEKAFDRGITLSPGMIYSISGHYENYMRLNCAVPMTDTVMKAVRTLSELIQ